MIKKIDKEIFDKLLKDNKEAALEMLKDKEGSYLEEVQIGEQKYKIFTEAEVPYTLLRNQNSGYLPASYSVLIVCNINTQGYKIVRTDFKD